MGMCFFRGISGYRMKNCKHNNDITELGIIYINTIRKCQRKWLQHFEKNAYKSNVKDVPSVQTQERRHYVSL
jgi:hypothetical protein